MVIFIDESGTHKQSGHAANAYERRLKKVLRDKGISVRKLGTVRNEISQPGIQLADALAGLSRYHFENPNAEDVSKWFERLKKEKKLSAQVIF